MILMKQGRHAEGLGSGRVGRPTRDALEPARNSGRLSAHRHCRLAINSRLAMSVPPGGVAALGCGEHGPRDQLTRSPRQKAPARSFRLRRRPEHNSQQGDMVIRALVRARLFGMQLLTLEARVVVGTDDGNWPAASSLLLSPHNPAGRNLRSQRPELALTGSGTMYARAIDLLEQGTDALERSRRPQHR